MRIFVSCIALLLLTGLASLRAQPVIKEKQPRILILLDGSSSMGYDWQAGEKRFSAASRIILGLMDSIYTANRNVEFALRVYGHQYPSQYNNCYDTKLEVMFSKDNWTQMSLRLASLNAIGVSPIAFSLKEAAEFDMTDPLNNTYSLILVTDGEESCGGDICAVMKELLAKKIDFKPYILSLVNSSSLKNNYECLGNYMPIVKETDIKEVVGKITESYKQMFMLAKIDKKILQTAVVNAPSAQKINIPKFEVKKEVEVKEEVPPPPAPKPKPVNTPPPVQQPVIKQPELTRDLTDRTNATVIPQERISTLTMVASDRTFPIYYATAIFKNVKVPNYVAPKIQDEVLPQPKPPAPTPKPVVANKSPVVSEPIKIVKATEIKPLDETPPPPVGDATFHVYISDGDKFFETTPSMSVIDKKTKKEVLRFSRTVSVNGVPHRQKLPPGEYYLTIADKAEKYGYIEFETQAGKNTAFTMPISNGTIVFSYPDGVKKQFKDYTALVFRRFESRPVVEQKVSQEFKYEPGTYNVRINTLPPWIKSFDLNFGETYGVVVPEEGDLVIANNQFIGKVVLYYPMGDQFRPFHTLTLDGSGKPITLKVLPGTYKAGYKKNPQIPLDEEIRQEFRVTSNNVTNLELIK